uniref:DNA topoisomerase 2-binding protein 1-A n=1 Tax=Lygus hesperus TaxID=30085 RepID=A0A146LJS3_LYGHE
MQLLSEGPVIIYFVQDSSNSNKDMGKAFLACQDAKLKPKIIPEEELNDVPHGTNVVFVLQEFSGKTFKSLSSSDSLIVGPRCLYHCVTNEVAIPSNESPVFTMAMKGVIATASQLPQNRKEEIASLISYMGGSYTDKLTSAVTHLISDEGRSPKCEKAIEHKIPIMKREWVNAVWEASKIKDVTAFDEEFMKYKLPPFKGMHISCSNLTQGIKKKIQAAVESNGGVYMTALEQNKTTALIIGEADGKKFQAAQLWGIPCLMTEWIFDSVEKGMALPSKNYLINPRPKCSTPTNDLPSFMSNDVSCIPFGESANNTVDETNSTMTSISSSRCQTKPVGKPQPAKPQMHEYKKYIDEINLSDASLCGLFLDGCKVFLSGFTSQEFDKMKKLINKSGATLFPEISDRLTHVIMGEFLPDHVKEIEKLSHKPQVVSVEWILASIRLKTTAPAEPYLCFKTTVTKKPVAPASPLSHKGLSLLKSNSNAESPKATGSDGFSTSRKLFVKAPVNKRGISSQDDDEPNNCKENNAVATHPVAQTIPPLPSVSSLAQAFVSTENSQPPAAPSASTTPGPQQNDTNASCNGSSIEISPFFKGLVFLVIGFDDPTTIIESIFAVGGKVESAHFQGVADYAVIPLEGISTQSTATEVVTPLWVEDCYEQNKVVSIEYFHLPVPHKPELTPLKGCNICVSGYQGKERTFIFHLAGALGALVQDSFSKKDHPTKNIFKSTHLVCKAPTGSKYNAALKWGVPVINESWLLACVSSGNKAPIEPHQFGEKGEVPKTPVNPAIQRVKIDTLDASSAIVGVTPSRTSGTPARVNETIQQDSEIASKTKDTFVKPADVPGPQSKTASPADVSGSKITTASPAARPAMGTGFNDITIPGGEVVDDGTKGRITPRNSFHNNTTVDCFITPTQAKRMSSISSAGKSPFHVDTPSSPYGRVFMEEGGNPSPDTRKKWKRFIDNMPDLYEGSPEVQEFRKRRPSTPLNVIMKQVWVKFGGAEIDGIDPRTGDLIPNGPFGEWAHENTSLCSSNVSQPKDNEHSHEENPKMNTETISKELSHLKSRLNSVLTPSQEKPADNHFDTPEASTAAESDKACHARAGNWITPKGIDKQAAQTEMQWDFGKPTISVSRQNQNIAKKLRLSHEDDDKSIREQVTKLFDNDAKETPKKEKRIFVLSQIAASSREKFEGIIKSLGGEVNTSPILDPKTTHLIVEKILRSEKLLCAVASGKWVLHSSYLTQCYQSRMFLPEEDYEWGNERSRNRLPSMEPGTTEWNLARAVHKWRVRRTDMGQPDAFRHFKAVILTSENKLAQYMRLLQAGNATILPKERILEATHIFWDEDKVSLPIDRAILKSKKIPVLKPVYLGDYLAKNPPPSVDEYSIR